MGHADSKGMQRTAGERMRQLLAIEETHLLLTLHTTGAEQAEHRELAQAAYDERMDLAFKAMAAKADQSHTTKQEVRQ